MLKANTLEKRVADRISCKRSAVLLREDFRDLGGYDQVGRALRNLVAKGEIEKIGYGIYAKTKKSSLTGKRILAEPLPTLAREALQRLGVEVLPSRWENAYNAGKSTQVPTGRMIAVKGRVNRKISYKGASISYERILSE